MRVFVLGRGVWKEFDQWPPAAAVTEHLYLSRAAADEAGSLEADETGSVPTSEFVFDPEDPSSRRTPGLGTRRSSTTAPMWFVSPPSPRTQKATQTVYHTAKYPSELVITVLED